MPYFPQNLLESGNVSGALHLAESAASGSSNGVGFEALVRHVRTRAAFVAMQNLELSEAKALFLGSNIDPREVRTKVHDFHANLIKCTLFQLISLYPNLLPSSSNFVRAAPPLHDLADINTITKKDEEKTKELEGFLADVIGEWRNREGEQFPFKLVRTVRHFL